MVAAPPVLRQWGLERVGFRFPDALPSGRGEGPQSTPPVRHVPEKHLHHTQTHQEIKLKGNFLVYLEIHLLPDGVSVAEGGGASCTPPSTGVSTTWATG
ncbi:hypothetical protein O3P69_001045 [Scylla paramamosain]|uniref:Uncharacterized protein n=1 Tax=Scylla paramamosain TaxID=85552 RepID=A0AAW0UR10_SCYPA